MTSAPGPWANRTRRPFRDFGGRFVPEALVPACQQLEEAFRSAWSDAAFKDRYHAILRDYAGRRARSVNVKTCRMSSACGCS